MANDLKSQPLAANQQSFALQQKDERAGVPQIILARLASLRSQLTRWIAVRGLGRVLIVMVAVLVLDMIIDRTFRMDLSQRLIMLVVMLGCAIYLLNTRLIRPLRKRPSLDALVYEVENKNRDLNESLLSAVQLARQQDLDSLGFSPTLATATIQQGIEQAKKIDFGRTIDKQQGLLNWCLMFAGIGLLTAIGIGVSSNEFLGTWFNRNIMLGSDQWPQDTYLDIAGAENGRLVLPRGADHRQLVFVREDSVVTDVDVTLEIENQQGTTTRAMKATGKSNGREYALVFHNVSSEFRFRALGGDAVSDWITVDLVEPPALSELSLTADLPEYTGVDSEPLEGTGPYSLLVGSTLQLKAESNKKLESFDVILGKSIFPMTSENGTEFTGQIPGEGTALAGGEYSVKLVDETGLANVRPIRFRISIREDAPPKVRANLLGIGGLVVPRARIPVSFNAQDEYAITKMAFDTTWKVGEEDTQGKSGSQLIDFGRLAEDNSRKLEDVRVLDLEPLEITPGSSLRFVVAAFDNRPPEPGRGNSQEFLLRVVTEEELRADLLRREIEQRKAFEQAYNLQLELMAEVQAVAARTPRPGQTQEEFASARERAMIELTRQQKNIGTNLNRISERFTEFLVEVKNNRLDEQENELAPEQRIEVRFDQKIIQPIDELDREFVSIATRQIDNCRRTIRNQADLAQSVTETVATQQEILERMKTILNSMMDSENFQEVINKLLEISAAEKKLIKEAKEQSKPGDIFDDSDGDIFDDK